MALIPISGYPSSFRLPAVAMQLTFGAGPTMGTALPKSAALIMPKLGTGNYTVNKAVKPLSETDVIAGAGAGSPIHRAYLAFQRVHPNGDLWIIPYNVTSGGTEVAADLDITWTTDPTGTGKTSLTISGLDTVEYSFDDLDTVTTIAAAMAALVNARTSLGVTASSALGVLTLVSKVPGLSGGDGTTAVHRVEVSIDAGVGTTVQTENGVQIDGLGLGTATAGADGATTEAANLLAALQANASRRYYYKGISSWDSTSVGHLRTHVLTLAEPNPGNRGFGHYAFTGVLAAAQALAITQNTARMVALWQQRSWHDPATLIGYLMAVRQKREIPDRSAAYDDYRDPNFQPLAAPDEADWLDDNDYNDALNDGLWSLRSNESGSFMVMAATTQSKDSTGTFDAFGAAEPHRVVIMDDIADESQRRVRGSYRNQRLKDDERLPDGTINTAQNIPRNTVTPSIVRGLLLGIFREYGPEGSGDLQELPEITEQSLRVVRDPDNVGRLEIASNFRTIDIAHQFTFDYREVTPN